MDSGKGFIGLAVVLWLFSAAMSIGFIVFIAWLLVNHIIPAIRG